jgi:putative phosphoesterase
MEIFSEVYREKLDREISFMKRLQDALGDMHDYDVWIEYLPRFINEVRGSQDQGRNVIRDIEQGLKDFLGHIRQLRASRYRDFEILWDEAREQRFFENLRVKVQEGVFGEDRVLGGEGTTKVAIMADIHGNLPALEAVLEDARGRGLRIFLNAGDSLGYGIFSNKIIELLCNSGVLSIKGNYDLKVLEGKGVRKDPALRLISRNLSQTGRSYLEILPERVAVNVGGKKLLMVHGSPRSMKESVFPDTPDSELSQLINNTREDFVVTAHTHIPFVKKVDGILWANPGSVGRPYDGDPRTSYAILTPEPESIEIVRVDYDIEGFADRLRKAGLPEMYARALLGGVPLDVVESEDGKLDSRSLRGRMSGVRRVAEGYGETDGHSQQVRKLALKLFDQLVGIHNLERRERYLLEAAALLHDIGWSMGSKAHNKASLKLILNDRDLPLSSTERLVIGSIARYHRKGPPRKRHANFGKLTKEDRDVVAKLSAILRVADGMDYGHSSVVRGISASLGTRTVVLSMKTRGNHFLEEQQVAKKKDLFERVFNRKLKLEWE